jgi:signal transduction histidine kinase
MPIPLNVLIVEDSADDAAVLVHELRSCGFDPKIARVDTEADFLFQLEKGPDIILSDYAMPHFNGLRAADLLRERRLDIPFILLSGSLGEEIAIEAMHHGVTDYLLKDRLARLPSAIEGALEKKRLRNERKLLEEQFIQAQKMEVVGQLAGSVAHDFNNILSVILGYNEEILSALDPGSPLHPYAEEIRHAVDRAVGLTRQLLAFSRKQPFQAVVLDVDEVVTSMDNILKRLVNENIELVITHGQNIGAVKADSGYLGQVLMNLVVNARDAMPDGGKLTVETSQVAMEEAGASELKNAGLRDFVVLAVSDTGTGMTEEVKKQLFQPFFTTKPKSKGTGLGLATCQTIIKQCGGRIEVQSELGKGTTFKIYLPRIHEAVDRTKSAIETAPPGRGSETLLLVEDDPSVRHLAVNVLRSHGYTVLSASNGQEGLHAARDHKEPPIHLAITDVVMPRMGGKVMAEWLKATYPNLKILFTSGYTDDAITDHGVLDPGVEFLPKPYSPATLARKVRGMLDSD